MVLVQLLASGTCVAQSDVDDAAWDKTLERIAPAVVTIEIDQTRAFDTEWNQSSQATGFVVDAEQGLILTNRHVVTPGPVVATAVFQNREEVELRAVYRDPVHDFGIYRYDPTKLRYIKPPALPLYPKARRSARRSASSATTPASNSRSSPGRWHGSIVKRRITASRSTTTSTRSTSRPRRARRAGPSGSPVIDIRGPRRRAECRRQHGAQSSFYLPLARVKRALELIQSGNRSRAARPDTLPVHAVRRARAAGLRPETEAEARRARPSSRACWSCAKCSRGRNRNQLQPGDILTHVEGKLVSTFRPLDEMLDDSVGRTLKFEVERGGEVLTRAIRCRTCMRSRRPSTSSSPMPSCTRCRTRWRGT
jgi:S1-C subfamily serine protease